MAIKDIIKIQDNISKLETEIKNLEKNIQDAKQKMEFLYVRLANISSKYSKNYAEVELAVNPHFPSILSRLFKLI